MTTTKAEKKNHGQQDKRSNKTSLILKGMAMTLAKEGFLIFRSYLDMVIDFIFSLFWDDQRKKIPDLEQRHKMLAKSAVELAAMIRNKQLKSEDLVRACVERIKQVNPLLNAVTDERFVDAIDEARAIDKQIESGLSEDYFKEKPFLGVPFTAKESHAAAGLRHTLGLRRRRDVRATEDAECVRLVKNAGAVLVAVTNVPEVNKWQETRNKVFGQTSNPYHTGRTTGGSSGGEAALAAARATPISLCSDIGGSTRMPAFYCGLFALNPTAGHTSLKGSALRSGEHPTMASIGFVSAHVGDLAPLTKLVAADRAPLLDLDRPVNIEDIKFFYTETPKDLRVSPIYKEMRQAMTRVVGKLSSPARSVRAYRHAGLGASYSLWRRAMTHEHDVFARQLTDHQGEAHGLTELAKLVVGQSEYTLAAVMKLLDDQVLPPVDPEWGDKLLEDLKQDLINTLGDNGVLLFPSAPAPAPYHYSLYLRPFNFAYWAIFNALHLPVAQVPLGLDSAGLPLGVQVVAGPRRDALCLAVAHHLQREMVTVVPPCQLHL